MDPRIWGGATQVAWATDTKQKGRSLILFAFPLPSLEPFATVSCETTPKLCDVPCFLYVGNAKATRIETIPYLLSIRLILTNYLFVHTRLELEVE